MMIKIYFIIVIICNTLAVASGQKVNIDTVAIAPFGKVYVYTPADVLSQNIIIMISGDGGWKFGVPEFAKEFSGMNNVVVAVDILRYYKHLRELNEDCYKVASDFVELGAAIERKYNFPKYIPSVVMGYSSGATLVYAILAQARPGTFIGGISLGFCPDIELPEMLCQINGLKDTVLVKDKSILMMPDSRLGNQWIVLQGKKDKICDYQKINDFVLKTVDASIVALPEAGHGFSNWSTFMPHWKAAYNGMISKYNSDQNQAGPNSQLKNIPDIITLGKTGVISNVIAVLFSGDGGWYGFEQAISDRLALDGISTIGIDTRKYFWTRKSPETTASDVASLLRYYSKEWNKTKFLLIGYSQGAEIVPFVMTRLPEDLKSEVTSLVMLSPAITTDFEVHISNMLGLGNKQNTYDVIAEISRIQKTRQIGIFGQNENTKVQDLLRSTNVSIVIIPGDHHYKGNSALIVQKMKDEKAF